jgi:hypothetical protein
MCEKKATQNMVYRSIERLGLILDECGDLGCIFSHFIQYNMHLYVKTPRYVLDIYLKRARKKGEEYPSTDQKVIMEVIKNTIEQLHTKERRRKFGV